MALEVGDSNNTTNVVIAIEQEHALVAGKQKMACLLLQTRSKDKPIGIVRKSGDIAADARLDGEEGPAAALVAMMEMATVGREENNSHSSQIFFTSFLRLL